ncbi:MAG TPA: hypothetical protein DCE41_04975 [Cytophagales bacterium]|nr:hypothetical protein [Cytophagales bacterium]HAA24439.1 hypothetical protein [Cytophagales bacterium]HAP58822.1 hypothetical protein [Cytophagales bacterium]
MLHTKEDSMGLACPFSAPTIAPVWFGGFYPSSLIFPNSFDPSAYLAGVLSLEESLHDAVALA